MSFEYFKLLKNKIFRISDIYDGTLNNDITRYTLLPVKSDIKLETNRYKNDDKTLKKLRIFINTNQRNENLGISSKIDDNIKNVDLSLKNIVFDNDDLKFSFEKIDKSILKTNTNYLYSYGNATNSMNFNICMENINIFGFGIHNGTYFSIDKNYFLGLETKYNTYEKNINYSTNLLYGKIANNQNEHTYLVKLNKNLNEPFSMYFTHLKSFRFNTINYGSQIKLNLSKEFRGTLMTNYNFTHNFNAGLLLSIGSEFSEENKESREVTVDIGLCARYQIRNNISIYSYVSSSMLYNSTGISARDGIGIGFSIY